MSLYNANVQANYHHQSHFFLAKILCTNPPQADDYEFFINPFSATKIVSSVPRLLTP